MGDCCQSDVRAAWLPDLNMRHLTFRGVGRCFSSWIRSFRLRVFLDVEPDDRAGGSEGSSEAGERLCLGSANQLQESTGLRAVKEEDVDVYEDVGAIVQNKLVYAVLWRGEEPTRDLARKSFAHPHNFDNELRVAQTISSHPYIVQYFGFSQDGDRKALYMELLDLHESNLFLLFSNRGRDLGDWNLLLQQSLVILLQIAEGMAHLHAHGFVHGDLKPDNVFVLSSSETRCIQVKVGDFGNAQPVVGYKCLGVGPRFFEAPEVQTWRKTRTRGVEHGKDSQTFEDPQKIDVFSFGTVIYQVLTGDISTERMVLPDFVSIREIFKSCGERMALLSLIEDCRNPKPEQRPSFSVIRERLQTLANVEIDGTGNMVFVADPPLLPALDLASGALETLASVCSVIPGSSSVKQFRSLD